MVRAEVDPAMRFAFLMDPIERVLVDKDTTFALMLEAQRRGHEVFTLGSADLIGARGTVYSAVWRTRVRDVAAPGHFERDAAEVVDVASLDAVFIRTDPPFDAQYLYNTLLLEQVRGRVLLVNDPRGIRDANEKLYAMHFPEVTPRTIVTAKEADVRAFLEEIGGPGVMKPLDGAGGRGIMIVDLADKNFRSIVETLTFEGRRFAMVQEFLPAVREGDKRVLLLDGEPLGAILRVPRADESRSNIHVGGRVEPCELDEHDRAIVAAVGERLRRDGLYFVGLDVIGGRLTEVNVTSPTGIQELSRFTGSEPESKVIAWAEGRARSLKGLAE
ncbi:MAG: Glutathione synthetase [Myxococcaceae bacterium]|nr:Glutathione synthetase [Myxococcaceae bacterium]